VRAVNLFLESKGLPKIKQQDVKDPQRTEKGSFSSGIIQENNTIRNKKLDQIAADVASISIWIKFWSILTLIGMGILVIVYLVSRS
jgi:hypothetical protein